MNNVGLHIDRPAVYAAHKVNSGALGDVGDFAGVGGHAGGNVAEREEEAAVGIAVQIQTCFRQFYGKPDMPRLDRKAHV